MDFEFEEFFGALYVAIVVLLIGTIASIGFLCWQVLDHEQRLTEIEQSIPSACIGSGERSDCAR